MLTVNAETHEIVIDRGDDQTVRFTITDETGAAVNVTGGQFWFTVKGSADDTDVNAKFQITEGAMVTTQAASGIIDVPITPSHTATLSGPYVYDFQMKLSGKVRTLRSGRFVVRKDVTLAT